MSMTLPVSLTLICLCLPAMAADCLDQATHDRLQQHYTDLSARFDLATLSQGVIDAAGEAGDLKGRLAACRKVAPGSERPDCDSLAKRLAAKEAESQALQDRLAAALDMDEYLATLRWRLQQPPCAK